jgi:hypothetical protein
MDLIATASHIRLVVKRVENSVKLRKEVKPFGSMGLLLAKGPSKRTTISGPPDISRKTHKNPQFSAIWAEFEPVRDVSGSSILLSA